MSRLYITLFDQKQFFIIEDLTDIDKQAVWAALKDQPSFFPNSVREMLTYATRSDPDRGIEIWTFQSELKRKELWEVAKEQPKDFIDLIHQDGSLVFSHKMKESA